MLMIFMKYWEMFLLPGIFVLVLSIRRPFLINSFQRKKSLSDWTIDISHVKRTIRRFI